MNQAPALPLDREEIRAMVREDLQRRLGGVQGGGSPGESSTPAVLDESVKNVITEADVRGGPAGAALLIRDDAIITPSARDLIHERSVEIRHRPRRSAPGPHRPLALRSH